VLGLCSAQLPDGALAKAARQGDRAQEILPVVQNPHGASRVEMIERLFRKSRSSLKALGE